MSNYTIEKLPGEPILIGATLEDWQPDVDIAIWAEDAYHVLDMQTGPVFYIADVLRAPAWTLGSTSWSGRRLPWRAAIGRSFITRMSAKC